MGLDTRPVSYTHLDVYKRQLEERSKGTPVTVISDLCRGREDIAELKQRRDCSEALYKASQEAINVYKLKIRTVDEDIKRTWSNGTGEGSY